MLYLRVFVEFLNAMPCASHPGPKLCRETSVYRRFGIAAKDTIRKSLSYRRSICWVLLVRSHSRPTRNSQRTIPIPKIYESIIDQRCCTFRRPAILENISRIRVVFLVNQNISECDMMPYYRSAVAYTCA